jgi:hypothetical protein
MQSIRLIALGGFFALIGLGLFAYTLRKSTDAARAGGAPVKKSELRAQQARQTETNKLRIGAAVLVAIGAALMMLS